MSSMPILFVSHGAPNLVLHKTACHDFLGQLGAEIPRPRAILVVSAHFETSAPAVTVDAEPATIYDFGGFEPALYQMTYHAPGAPALARQIAGALTDAGLPAAEVQDRGFDHGTWVPLKLIYPDADIPVVQLSVQPKAGPAHHLALGRALKALAADGILVIGSGALTHNLHEFFSNGYRLDTPAPDWVRDFGEWMRTHIEAGDTEALVDYRRKAPNGARNHPTEEHLMPLFVAMGAATGPGQRIHTSEQYGVLMMDVYAFPGAAA